MTEKAAVIDCDIKNEKVRNIQQKIKIGTKGKSKLSNMKQLLEINSEQLKQKISEYFESHRRILDEREAKLLNKVNSFIGRRILEIDDKLKQLQQKLDHLNKCHCCLEDKNIIDDPTPDNFDYFVAASRYEFYAEKDGLKSSFKKLGALKQTDVLVTRFDSSDEDDSDIDDLCDDNIVAYEFLKTPDSSNKSTETELSDAASSCSVLSYKGEEYEDEKNMMKKLDDMDDFEHLVLETPKEELCEKSIIEDGKMPSTNLSTSNNKLVINSKFEGEMVVEKMLKVLSSLKQNRSEIDEVDSQNIKEEKSCKEAENKESNLAEKVVNSIKLCQSNQQKAASDIGPIHNLKIGDLLHLRATKPTDHSCLISDFNSRVQMILNESASRMLHSDV